MGAGPKIWAPGPQAVPLCHAGTFVPRGTWVSVLWEPQGSCPWEMIFLLLLLFSHSERQTPSPQNSRAFPHQGCSALRSPPSRSPSPRALTG